MPILTEIDPEIAAILDRERIRQNTTIQLIPYDRRPPLSASGIRIGTPAVTFRGFDLDEIAELAGILAAMLENPADEVVRGRAQGQVRALCARFPIYESAKY